MTVADHQALDHVLLHHAAAGNRVDHLVQCAQNVVS
jgi:hypothetical protein